MQRIALGRPRRFGIRKDERDPVTKKFRGTFKRFLKETDGFETIEYSIMTALIIGAISITLVLMMVVITDTFADAAVLM